MWWGGGGEVSKYFKEKSHDTAQFKRVEIMQQTLLGGGGGTFWGSSPIYRPKSVLLIPTAPTLMFTATPPASLEMLLGDQVELPCQAEGSFPQASITWTFKGKHVRLASLCVLNVSL